MCTFLFDFFDRRPVPFGGSRCIETYSSTTSRSRPVPGGNRSAASCLCTVLRRALYHYSTRSPVCTFLFELQKLANLQCCLFCVTVRAEEFSKVCLTLAPGHTLSRVLTLCGLVLIVVHTLSKRCLLTLEEPALGPSWVICQHTVRNTRYCARASCDCRRHCTV